GRLACGHRHPHPSHLRHLRSRALTRQGLFRDAVLRRRLLQELGATRMSEGRHAIRHQARRRCEGAVVNRKLWWLYALVLTTLVARAADSTGAPPVFVLRIAGATGPAPRECR